MKKSKTNVSVVSNVGIRRNVNVHVGDNGSFPSGDILDANATKQLVDNVAVTGDYNDLENKPTIPNVAVVNLEMEDIDTSTNGPTIANQDKISLVCDLIDAGTFVICNLQGGPFPSFGFCFLVPIFNGTSLNNVTLFATSLSVNPSENPPIGHPYVVAYADVTSRYVTSNTEP